MERSFEAIAQNLDRQGFVVDLLTTRTLGGGYPDSFAQFRKVQVAPQAARSGRYSIAWWIYALAFAWRHRGAYSIIFSVSSAGLGFALSRDRNRLISQCHGTAFREAISNFKQFTPKSWLKGFVNLVRTPRDAYAYRHSSAVVAVSDNVATDLRTFPYRIRGEDIHVIYNGVAVASSDTNHCPDDYDSTERDLLGISKSQNVGTFVGRIEDQKGVDRLIHALAMGSSEMQLVVCGEGPMEATLKHLADRLSISQQVIFLGLQPASRVRTIMQASDCVLLPSRRREGLPLVLLEALAERVPIIASSEASVPSDLLPFVVLADEPRDIAKAWSDIRKARSDEILLPERYQDRYSLSQYANLVSRIVSLRS